MKALSSVLAILVGAASLSALGVGPARPVAHARPAARHDCCCAECPGPGLCPCAPGSSTPCVRSSDDPARDVGLPSALSPLKLVCEGPRPAPRLDFCERRDEPERLPDLPIPERRLEKVPISFA